VKRCESRLNTNKELVNRAIIIYYTYSGSLSFEFVSHQLYLLAPHTTVMPKECHARLGGFSYNNPI